MGWFSLSVDRSVSMVRFWNRLINMSNDKLTKRMFLKDYQLCHNNWSSHIKFILEISRDIVNFNLKRECKIANVRKALIEQFIVEWNQQMLQKPKLRTYVTFKHVFATETYIMQTLSRSRRSFLVQFRLEILPLEIKTGR